MANIARVRCVWSGSGVVGPALSTHYFDEAGSGFPAALVTFYESIKGIFPQGLSIQIPGSGDLIDVATGELAGSWSDAGANTVVATTAGGYAAGAGMRVEWKTAGIRNGRRVTGSTFLVPLLASSYSTTGALQSSVSGAVSTAAQALLNDSANVMHVWSRPSAAAGAGMSSAVISQEVTNTVSTLRSRRT